MTGRPVVTAAAAPHAPRHGLRTAVVANPTKVSRPDAVRDEITRSLAAHGWPTPSWLETTRDDPGGGQAAQSVRMGADLLRRRPTSPLMEVCRGVEIEVSSDRRHPRELDGDLIAPAAGLTATIRPGVRWLCIP